MRKSSADYAWAFFFIKAKDIAIIAAPTRSSVGGSGFAYTSAVAGSVPEKSPYPNGGGSPAGGVRPMPSTHESCPQTSQGRMVFIGKPLLGGTVQAPLFCTGGGTALNPEPAGG